jgi:GTP 3',8-cyclase
VTAGFVEGWRRRKSAAFDLQHNSTARRTVRLDLWGRAVEVYANANLSVYSAQTCNAKCPFCVEELRPASRGLELSRQKTIESDDGRYFAGLEAALAALRPMNPSVSVTGGEPSKDPRLPRILRTLERHDARKRTLTTNGSGLLDVREGLRNIDWITATGVRHLNISRAHPDHDRNAELMRLDEGLRLRDLEEVIRAASRGGTRVRLSCVLLTEETDSIEDIVRYIDFARSIGVDNVIFRQLMKTDPRTVEANFVVRYSDKKRVQLEPLLDALSQDPRFTFRHQIMGYYYYVEVWNYGDVDVVFEEADLAQLEVTKRSMPGVVHELIFHPNAKLASTWQPWDGIIGPPPAPEDQLVRAGAAG